MDKRSLSLILVMLFAFPAFVCVAGDDDGGAPIPDVDDISLDIGFDVVKENGKFKRLVKKPGRWMRSLQFRLSARWKKIRHGETVGEQFEGLAGFATLPGEQLADTSIKDVTELSFGSVFGDGWFVSGCLTVALTVALYKLAKSKPVKENVKAAINGMKRTVGLEKKVGQEAEKKTA